MAVTGYLLIAALVIYSLYRQLQVQRLIASSLVRMPIIFTIIGVAISGDALLTLFKPAQIPFTLLSLVITLVAGILRGFQIRIWKDDHGWLYRGTWLTVVIWLLMIGAKVGIGVYQGFSSRGESSPSVGEIFLFIAVSFIAQNLVLAMRTGLLTEVGAGFAGDGTGAPPAAPFAQNRSDRGDPAVGPSRFHP